MINAGVDAELPIFQQLTMNQQPTMNQQFSQIFMDGFVTLILKSINSDGLTLSIAID
ncbi:MAG: hypothetical protein JKY89_08825 [Immundisolibacteraceae bacterium]|nr:hypothetical protein [Immundisolibacteraceae bacterium]